MMGLAIIDRLRPQMQQFTGLAPLQPLQPQRDRQDTG